MIARLGEKAEKAREKADEERRRRRSAARSRQAAGQVAELDPGRHRRPVGCRPASRARCPLEKQAKLAGLKVGDKVKIYCLAGVLAGIERAPSADERKAGEEHKLYGKITELSRASVTVQGEAGTLTCTPPASVAEKIVGRFAVGDSVKMMCRGSELTYLEKV